MPHLELYKNRMMTDDTPYIYELQSYYKKKSRSYSFPVCGDILRRIKDFTLSGPLTQYLRDISRCQRAVKLAYDNPAFSDGRLMDYQKSGVSWLLAIERGILADDQAAGKTVMSLVAANHVNMPRTLIFCSKTKIDEWSEETERWTGCTAQRYNKGMDDWTGYLITNYATALSDPALLRRADTIIIDEAHVIRNRKTQLFKRMLSITRKATYVFLLTASPTVNTISDFWTLLCICDEARFRSYWGFAFRFCEIHMDRIGMKVGETKESEKDNLRRILDTYIISRTGEDNLPVPQWHRIDYRCSLLQRKLYSTMDETMEVNYDEQVCMAMTPLAKITRLRQLTLHPGLIFKHYDGHSKLDPLPKLIYEWEGQTLIFAQYARLVEMAAEYLNERDIVSVYLSNELTATRRSKYINLFKSGDARVLAMTFKLGGEGLNLPMASQVIFLEYSWNPAGMRHAYKRVLRRGQTSEHIRFVLIHASGTIEDHILDILKEKKKVTIEEIIRRNERRA